MNAAEYKRAFEVANSDIDLSDVDDTILDGYGLPGFGPVVATVKQVAKVMRWQARYLNGEWDGEQLTEIKELFRKRVTVVG